MVTKLNAVRPGRISRISLTAGIAAAFCGLFGMSQNAAFAAAGPAKVGRLVLFQNPNWTGSVNVITVQTCNQVRRVAGMVGSFDNAPPAGCRVWLETATGLRFALCTGRGVVPAQFRQSPSVVFRAGVSVPCAL
ncbi:hypothetical protein [Actinomadura sp. 6N118]|uniref:hypothetical protein n=1 Tax=Actinomadura sp. 6N118 TaxID=3375151 RepID=UPI00378EEC1E